MVCVVVKANMCLLASGHPCRKGKHMVVSMSVLLYCTKADAAQTVRTMFLNLNVMQSLFNKYYMKKLL